jgi:O-antigen/teichoic acid export membrane protein
MEDKAIHGVPWTVLSFAANKCVTLLTTLVLAHLLAPSDFGVIAIALMVVNFLFWFGGLSFAGTLIVRQDLDVRGQGTIMTLMLCSGVLAAAIAAATAPLVAGLLGNARITSVLLVLTSVFVISAFNSFYDSLLQRDLEFRRRFAALAVQTTTYAAVAITLAALGAGVWSFVFGLIVSSLLYAVALVLVAPRRVRPALDRSQLRSLVVTGRGFLAQGVTVFVRQNADNVTVGRAFGSAALGFYSMAYRLGDLSYWAIADPVARVTFPAFARSRERGEDIRGSFLSVLRLVALVGCPAGVILSAAAEPFTRAILGTRWLPMAAPMAVLGIWAAVRPIDSTLSWLLNSAQHAGAVAWLSAAILVPLVPGFIIAVSIGHLTAVAVVVVLDTMISVVALALVVQRYLDIRVRDMWRAVAPIVVASPAAWGATFGAAHAVGMHPAGLSLLAAVASGLVTYVLAVWLLDHSLPRQTAGQLLRIFGRRRQPVAATP